MKIRRQKYKTKKMKLDRYLIEESEKIDKIFMQKLHAPYILDKFWSACMSRINESTSL